jgi:hypothetical protein
MPDTKIFKGIICGLLAISIISIVCAGAGVENDAGIAKEEAIQTKVGAGSEPASVPSSEAYVEDYFPKFEKIIVDPSYKYLQMKPGESANFSVTVENRDNKTIELRPMPLITPYTEKFINESWISISPSEKSLKPGEKEEFEVKVIIPEDAEIGNYAVLIAFTENVPEGDVAGYYPNFPGTMQLNVQVWVPPTVQILTPYVNDLVEAGKSYTYEIKLKNTGDKDIALSPELTEEGGIIYADSVSSSVEVASSSSVPGQAFGNEVINVESPDKIKAGQTAVVKLTLAVPADAKGSYSGSLDLNVDDPGIQEYAGRVPLSFRILPVLKEPYETTFEARTADLITLEVKAYQYGYGLYTSGGNRDLTPSFNVSLKDPSGKEVTPTLVNTKYIGSINIVDDTYPRPYPILYESSKVAGNTETYDQGTYQGGTTTFVETYTVPGTAGKWTLSILPKNTENFEYTVTVGGSEE